jgi:hypothetical protein
MQKTPFVAALKCFAVAALLLGLSQPAFSHLTLNQPNGGETFTVGSTATIEWEIDISHNTQNWDLWYRNSPTGPWISIVFDLPAGATTVGSIHTYNWVVPADISSQVRVRARMDNTGTDYFDISDADLAIVGEPTWADLGGGTVGINGQPTLVVTGSLAAGSNLTIDLTQAPNDALMLFRISLTSTPANVVGGTLYALPFDLQLLLVADATGAFNLVAPVAAGAPSGQDIWIQFIVQDLSTLYNITLSNARTSTTP